MGRARNSVSSLESSQQAVEIGHGQEQLQSFDRERLEVVARVEVQRPLIGGIHPDCIRRDVMSRPPTPTKRVHEQQRAETFPLVAMHSQLPGQSRGKQPVLRQPLRDLGGEYSPC
jgi:hypothetical protein